MELHRHADGDPRHRHRTGALAAIHASDAPADWAIAVVLPPLASF